MNQFNPLYILYLNTLERTKKAYEENPCEKTLQEYNNMLNQEWTPDKRFTIEYLAEFLREQRTLQNKINDYVKNNRTKTPD